MKTLLLTWWTWYIGSHNAVLFIEKWYDVIILDNLSNSSESVIKSIWIITWKTPKFYNWDIRNVSDIEDVFLENKIDAVIHFAGLKAVWESCEKPFDYYENNVIWTMNLIKIMEQYNCKNMIFSSSATVYDPGQKPPFSENTLTGNTTNPYGTSKFIIENILRDLANHKNLRVINLRYFNPVGAHRSGLIWENPNDIPNNLLPYIMKVASWELCSLSVYWNDYDTIDGTWVRDYIHVEDLAAGHLASIKYLFSLETNWIFEVFNLGTGNGTSVIEMIHITEEIIWMPLQYKLSKRRIGDIASAYCTPKKAESILGWKAKKTVKEAISDSWNFITTNTWK